MNNINKKSETFYLWWHNNYTQKLNNAGVAFYDERFGEYKLNIDMWPGVEYILRPVGHENDKTIYRGEVTVRKNGKYFKRMPVAEGFSDESTEGYIHVQFWNLEKPLFLTFNARKKENTKTEGTNE